MQDEKASAALALALMMLLSVLAAAPAKGFIYSDTSPPWGSSYDLSYEFYGPHVDQLLFKMYPDTNAMWTAMGQGQIDVCDWPLTPSWRTTFSQEPYVSNITVVDAGGEAGFYTIAFNMNPNPKKGQIFPFVPPYGQADPDGQPNPVYISGSSYSPPYPYDFPPISCDENFRLGVAHLFNRIQYGIAMGQAGIQILTPVPAYMGLDVNGGYIWSGCPGYEYSRTLAEQYFEASSIKCDAGSGWKRYWDKNSDGIAQQAEVAACVLRFPYRADIIRKTAGEMLTSELRAMNFSFAYSGIVTAAQDYTQTAILKNFHMTTIGWLFVGPDPDYLYDLYNIANYWDDEWGSCPNGAAVNDTVLNDLTRNIKYATSPQDAWQNTILFQQRFWSIAAQIPLASASRYMAQRRWYSGGNAEALVNPDDGENVYRQWPNGSKRAWMDFCNEAGAGSNSWFSMLNGYPDGCTYGTGGHMTLRCGWSELGMPGHINPLYSDWLWDDFVLCEVYGTLGYRDPYVKGMWRGNIARNWTVGVWDDHGVNHSKCTVTIRSDAKFADGTPITIGDVIFSLVDAGNILIKRGLPPPWWWPTGSQVKSLSILDAYTVEILYGVESMYLVEDWTLGFYIIPKHIWLPIIDQDSPNPPTAKVPDPNVIGSGPFRYKSWDPDHTVLLVANMPGSIVQTDRAGSVPITSSGYHAYYPVEEYVYTADYKHKYAPTTAVSFNVKTDNLWWGGPLDIADCVVITWPNATTTTVAYSLIGLAAHTSGIHTIGPYTWPKCRTLIDVTSTITSAGPWQGKAFHTQWFIWGSIREDIVGSSIYKDYNYYYPYRDSSGKAYNASVPTPDCRVDAKDVAGAAAAFGSRPGTATWWSAADIIHDYKINAKDIAAIARMFGWGLFWSDP